MVSDDKSRKIMTKPLPQILDEIEDSIRKADEAAKTARDAALEARQATEVEQIAKNALELVESLKEAMIDRIAAINRRLTGNTSEPDETAEK